MAQETNEESQYTKPDKSTVLLTSTHIPTKQHKSKVNHQTLTVTTNCTRGKRTRNKQDCETLLINQIFSTQKFKLLQTDISVVNSVMQI